MTRKRYTLFAAGIIFLLSCIANTPLLAENKQYNYLAPEELKTRIESGDQQCILDIQVQEEYTEHHIKGAVPTYAYPVKTEAEKNRIEAEVAKLAEDEDPIIIVCPRGGGGAERTYDYLLNKGIEPHRLYILEKGQGGWPYEELLEKKE